MKRREFITLAATAATWPLAARAQQLDRVRRIGVLFSVSESDPEGQAWLSAFREGLQQLGWTAGRNINEALKKGASSGIRMKVSEKGAVSIYGMGRFPVTLYKEQWLKLLDMSADIRAFIAANEALIQGRQ